MDDQHLWEVPLAQTFPNLEYLRVPEDGYGLGLKVGVICTSIDAPLLRRPLLMSEYLRWCCMLEVCVQMCFEKEQGIDMLLLRSDWAMGQRVSCRSLPEVVLSCT